MEISFEKFLQAPFNALVEQAVQAGRIPIGYTCSYIPDAMLSTGNLFPFRLRAPGVNGTEIADIYLSNMVCSYPRSILELAMDDKCAAGTGRFLEMMSRSFRLDLSAFSALSLQATHTIPITSQCSVFAETEVISLLSKKIVCRYCGRNSSICGKTGVFTTAKSRYPSQSSSYGRLFEK